MRDLIINSKNHADLTSNNNGYGSQWRKCLDANIDLNNLLDEELKGNEDWGGKYHAWLKSFGIDPETDNGWWSLAAIDRDNIEDYIRFEKEDEFFDRCQFIRKLIGNITIFGKFTSYKKKVREIITEFEKDQTI